MIQFRNDHVVIDPIALFPRLIALIQHTNDICGYFAYELPPAPTSLFKGSVVQKPSKSALAKALDKKVQTYVQDSRSNTDIASVVPLSTSVENTEEVKRFKKEVGV